MNKKSTPFSLSCLSLNYYARDSAELCCASAKWKENNTHRSIPLRLYSYPKLVGGRMPAEIAH